jgi:glycosyltransferase involved in cell wall biosynthesis
VTESKTIALLLPDLRAGGAERVAIGLMHSFRAAGHRVDFVLMQKEGEFLGEIPPDVRIVDLGASRIRHAIRPLVRYFREPRPDAVQVSLWPLTVAGIIARRLAGSTARLVVSDHAALSKQFAGQPLTLAALRLSARLFYPWADARVLVANAAADDLVRLTGLPRACFEVIYNPVDAPARVHSTPEIEALWGDADGRIITVGTLKAVKNQALLIRAFARLRQRRAARLMILGAGALESELKRLAASLGVADHVIFPGFAADPWPYYASANLFALSSDYEGYPLVLIEAMLCGLPIVSTDCESGPREILDGGKYGRLVPVGDERALAEAIEKELARPHSPGLVRDRAEQLSGASTAERYLELLIGPKGR